jgi:hypothetical protein
MNFSNRYVPKNIAKKDKQKQIRMLLKSRKMYKKHQYYTRKPLASFKNKKSNHVENARRMYRVETITPNQELAQKTGCTMAALKKIVKKGEGAYYSSGSRPNQTPQSWGLARLASSITAGKAANVDFAILEQGCDHKKKAFRLAKTLRRTSR